MKTLIQAHRGASAYRPENTMEAFAFAVEQGADAVELDVHLTKDGHIVVAHDERLERVSDHVGFINEFTLDELKGFNFNKQFPEQPPCSIPTLGEVYGLLKNTELGVNVELKTTEFFYPELPQKLIDLARDFDMEERVIYSSFNHYSLSALKQIKPDAKTGLLYGMGIVDPWVYANYVSAYAIHPHYRIIAALPEVVGKCHENGVKINVWTVDDPEAVGYMLKLGVDGIITNKPDAAVKIRDEFMKGNLK